MKFKNVVIVVNSLEESIKFYHDLFGLEVVLNQERNVILTEGLVLQEKKVWEEFLNKTVVSGHFSCELYFEEADLDAFVRKLERIYPAVQYINRPEILETGQKMVRFCDPDGHLLEIRTPVSYC